MHRLHARTHMRKTRWRASMQTTRAKARASHLRQTSLESNSARHVAPIKKREYKIRTSRQGFFFFNELLAARPVYIPINSGF